MAIKALIGVSNPTQFGVNAIIYRITDANVSFERGEVFVILKGYTNDAATNAIDTRIYAVSTDPTLTAQQIADREFIGQATPQQLQDIYLPSIDLLYEHILNLPEWANATRIEIP